jgi:hypothetical protein
VYPKFFWSMVTPYIGDALSNLHMTQEGKLWVANLYSHIFAESINCRPSAPNAYGIDATSRTSASGSRP